MAKKKADESRKKEKTKEKRPSFLLWLLIIAGFLALLYAANGKLPESWGVGELFSLEEGHVTRHVSPPPAYDGVHCRFDFIDVGQGDSTLVTTPNGRHILIDAGPSESEEKLIRHLDSLGVTTLDYLVLTHPHADHIGGAAEVLYGCRVETVLMPNVAASGPSFTKLLDAIADEKENGCKVYAAAAGDEYTLDGCTLTVLAPSVLDRENLNNSSVVLRVLCGDISALITGDAEAQEEERMLREGRDVACDILKLGHHGSSTSTTAAFLDAAKPDVAIISCGKDNDYGHPHAETLRSLMERKIPYYSTANVGTITVVTDGKEIEIRNAEK